MRKIINNMFRAIIIMIFALNFTNLNAQLASTFQTTIRNVEITSDRTLEFDIYLLNTDAVQSMEMATYQAGITLNPAIYGSGTLTPSIVTGYSTLTNPFQTPTSIIYAAGPNVIKLAAKAPLGYGSGSIISRVEYGTRIVRIKLTSSVAFTANTTPDLFFQPDNSSLYSTQVALYIGTTNTQFPVTMGVNAFVYGNPLSIPLPLVYNVNGGGAYCQGSNGKFVGLVNSENGVNYTLYKDITNQLATITGNGSAVNFGYQLSGNYTVKATNSGGTSEMSGTVNITENLNPSAPTFVLIQPTCNVATGSIELSGLPTGNWSMNQGSITGATLTATLSGLSAGSYPYTVTNEEGCTSLPLENAVINVQPVTPSVLTAGTVTQPTCTDATGTIELSGLPSGNWTINPGSITGSTATTTLSVINAGTYPFTVTNDAGCTSQPMENVIINIQPVTPSVLTVGTITQPTCAVATGSIALSNLPAGNWTMNPGLITGATPTTTLSGLTAGTYNYTVTNDQGCTSLVTANIDINVQPVTPSALTVVTTTQPTCAVATGNIEFSGLPAGNWTINPVSLNGTGATASVASITPESYSFTVTNAVGCTSLAKVVVINAQPVTPSAPTGTAAQSFVYNASATVADLSATGTSIQWYAASTGGNALSATTLLTTATHYFASQQNVDCESSERFDVTVTLFIPTSTIITSIQTPTPVSCEDYDVNVTVKNFNNVGAISLKLNYNPSVFAYQSVTINPDAQLISAATNGSNGIFTMGWSYNESNSQSLTLDEDAVLFTLHFKLLPSVSGVATNLTWSSISTECEYSSTLPEVYTSIFNNINWTIPVRPVKNINTAVEYCKIQDAVINANSGNTITIAAGTYVEAGQIVIDKNLSIIGENKTTTFIQPASDIPEANYKEDASAWFLINSGITFNLSQVTLDGTGKFINNAILSHGHGVINNNIIKNIEHHQSTHYDGCGIALYGSDMTVSNNTFSGIGREGILSAFYSTTVITGNTYTGKGNGDWLDYAFEVGRNSTSVISANMISGNTGIATVDGSTSSGIIVSSYFDLTGVTTGASITENIINGSFDGISVGYDASDVSIVTAHENNLSGNTNKAITTTAAVVNASCNWFGTTADAVIASKLTGSVTYNPWLVNGTDNNGATQGFESVPGSCLGTPIIVTLIDKTDVTCVNNTDGAININVSAGLFPYSFVWTPNGTGQNPTGLAAGTYSVTVTDYYGSTNTLAGITIGIQIDVVAPVITCPANIIVFQQDPKDPYATGIATATDNCGTVTITYNDDRSGLNSCNVTGTILRTWIATDASGNVSSCVQTITVSDNTIPVAVSPQAITVINDAGLCSAVVNFTPTATDFGFFQGFENSLWLSGAFLTNPSTDWNEYNSQVVRVSTNTNGITSKTGSAHAVINNPTGIIAGGGLSSNTSGIFSRMGGYSNVFGNGFTSSIDVYFDLSDPKILANEYGWDVSVAANDNAGNNLRDFIFTVADDGTQSGTILVNAANGSSQSRNGNLGTLLPSSFQVTSSGWYTLQWNFRNNGSDVLAVDLNILNAGGTQVWTRTLSAPQDVISTVGGNRYMWFTFVQATNLSVDNTTLTRNLTTTSSPASGSVFPFGTTAVTVTATDACGKIGTSSFNVNVNDVEIPTIQCADNVTVANVTGNCSAEIVLTAPTTHDNCGVATVTNDHPQTTYPVGTTQVVWTVTDIHGLTASCTQNVTVTDNEAPVITCPLNVAVNQLAPKDPYSTGIATATDNCGTATITYNDDRSGLNSCNVTGTILRTWTATDAKGNASSCIQTITVSDNTIPVAVSPQDITVTNGTGLCSAVVNFTPTATDFGFFQGFENSLWLSGAFATNPSTDWNEYNSQIVRVPTGTNGITSKTDLAHAVISNPTGIIAGGGLSSNTSGIFSRMGGYSNVFGNGFTSSIDVYFDLSDPKILANEYGWDVSCAANDNAGNNLRDFIFTVADDGTQSGTILVNAANGSSQSRNGNLSTLPSSFPVTTSGWYTLQWNFRNNGSNVLAVDLNILNAGGTQVWTSTLSAPQDVISTVGGNRYMWFTYVQATNLSVDNTTLTRNLTTTSSPASGSVFPVGTTAVAVTTTDACGNTGTSAFNVTVNDAENPTIVCATEVTFANVTGNCSAEINLTLTPPTTNDNCGVANVTNDHSLTTYPVGTTPVLWTVTDVHGLTASCTQNVTVTDTQIPVITCPGTLVVEMNNGCTYIGQIGTASATDNCTASPVITNDAPSAFPQGSTTVTWKATDASGNFATCEQTVTVNKVMLSGTLKYNNAAKSPMNNVTLTLTPGGATSITSNTGYYSFPDLCAGNYTIVVTENLKPVGGVNSTDAAGLKTYMVSGGIIEKVKFLAGDVNNGGYINATDALGIQLNFVFGNVFNRSKWSYWNAGDMMISTIFNPENIPVTVDGNTTQHLYAQVTGDFNGNFSPNNLKSSVDVSLNNGIMIHAEANTLVDLPVRIINAAQLGAVSLVLNFPSELVEVQNVSIAGQTGQINWTVNGNELRIGWFTDQPVSLNDNDNLIILSLKTTAAFINEEVISFSMASDVRSELADNDLQSIENAQLKADNLTAGIVGTKDLMLSEEGGFTTYPNPFDGYTQLAYNLPFEGKVTIEIHNYLGAKVATLIEEQQFKGNNIFRFDTKQLAQGMYTATLRLKGLQGEFIRSIKLIRNK